MLHKQQLHLYNTSYFYQFFQLLKRYKHFLNLFLKILSTLLFQKNLNYNIFFRDNFSKVLRSILRNYPKILGDDIKSNKSNVEIISFLVNNQFILLSSKKPMRGVLLENKVFFEIIDKYGNNKFNYKFDKILGIDKYFFNPFENKMFEFLSGSAQLEGGTVTIGETIELLTKDIYPNKPPKDIQMVKNLNEAMLFVADNLESDLTLDNIKKLNEICLFSLHKGGGIFKINSNKIHGNPKFKTVEPAFVEMELKKFCNVFNAISSRQEILENIGYIHNQFQRVHPFADGNSRVTRLIVNWLLLKFNFPLFLLKVGAFESYMNLTKLSKIRDDEAVKDFILAVLWHENIAK